MGSPRQPRVSAGRKVRVVAEGSPLGTGPCQAAGRSLGLPRPSPGVLPVPPGGSTPGVLGACPPCPSPGFCPRAGFGGGTMPPPPGSSPLPPLPSPPAAVLLPQPLLAALGHLSPCPTSPPCLGRILPCCPVPLLSCAGAAIRGAGACAGGLSNASSPRRERGAGSCPLPAPAAPGGGSAPRSFSGWPRWLPTCQRHRLRLAGGCWLCPGRGHGAGTPRRGAHTETPFPRGMGL